MLFCLNALRKLDEVISARDTDQPKSGDLWSGVEVGANVIVCQQCVEIILTHFYFYDEVEEITILARPIPLHASELLQYSQSSCDTPIKEKGSRGSKYSIRAFYGVGHHPGRECS